MQKISEAEAVAETKKHPLTFGEVASAGLSKDELEDTWSALERCHP